MADDVIRVEVLGTPRILKNGVETSFSRKRVRALLFYLATELKPVPRTTLAWLFWPDKSPQVASRNLSIHLSYLKNALSEDAVISSQGTIALAEDVESDARDYFTFANNPNRNGDHNPLELFRGPFLDGFSIKDADPFDQWVSSEAQQWRNRSIDAALERSFDLEIQKRYTDALATIERTISENEIREDLYRRAMSIMEKAGMRAQVGEVCIESSPRALTTNWACLPQSKPSNAINQSSGLTIHSPRMSRNRGNAHSKKRICPLSTGKNTSTAPLPRQTGRSCSLPAKRGSAKPAFSKSSRAKRTNGASS